MDPIENNHNSNPSEAPVKKSSGKKLATLLVALGILVVALFALQYTHASTTWLWNANQGGQWLFPLVVVAALLDSINPCAISVLLLTVTFLFSLGRSRGTILKTGGFYIFGNFVIYVFIGLGILRVLHLFNTPHFMARVGASLLILTGTISLINEFFPRFPIKLRIPKTSHKTMAGLMEKASLPAAFLLGGFVGLCEFPCTGGPYLLVLGLLHDQSTYLSGFLYLMLYNLIFISPLVLILLIASDQKLLEKVQEWKKTKSSQMRLYGGLAVIILGLIIFLF